MENKLNDIKIYVSYQISKDEYMTNPERFEEYTADMVRQKVAQAITIKHMKSIDRGFYFERKVELFVATPEIFWETVKREAEKIAYYHIYGEGKNEKG